eukprot:UN23437
MLEVASKKFDETHLLKDCLDKVKKAIDFNNEVRRDTERSAKLLTLGGLISDLPFPIWTMDRTVISSDHVCIIPPECKEEIRIVICSDIVIVCEIDWRYKFSFDVESLSDVYNENNEKRSIEKT